jgi:Ca2+/Na+ antiporter
MKEQERFAEKQQLEIIQLLTTEHYNLQAARSVATSEAISRSNLFISTVSTTMVALALIGQISRLGTAFFMFALLLFPSLFFLGLVSLERAIQTTIEDNICLCLKFRLF